MRPERRAPMVLGGQSQADLSVEGACEVRGLTQGGHRYRPKPRAWYRTSWFAFLAVLGVLAVVVVILVVPVWATSTPQYCSSCKATKKAGQQWERSTHAKVSCIECHIPPGVGSQVKWRSREWLNIWADYLNVSQVASKGARPGNENCLQCHTLDTIPNESDGIRMPHQVHVDMRDLSCADCHDDVAHPGPGEARTGVSMSVCSMCHNQQGASADCEVCHISAPPKDVHPSNYLETHGQEATRDETACLRCHHSKADFCDACHANPTPDHFSGDWRYTHGPTAEQDRPGCLGCHSEDTFCEQCHRVSHPSDWEQTHGEVAAKSQGACQVCHPQGMCTRCHEQRGVGQ